eukprot:gb/GEZN01013719.1/.p1 GENE.gb/GEZN01013719.1/~~gb/GEZN01013719.1/.p1  ORF type:complete len:221 (+),score=6.64 gb/GEZN01013719.1/:30-665(+)
MAVRKSDQVLVYFCMACLFCYSIGLGGHWISGTVTYTDRVLNCTVDSHSTLWKVCTTWGSPCDQFFPSECVKAVDEPSSDAIQGFVIFAFIMALFGTITALLAPWLARRNWAFGLRGFSMSTSTLLWASVGLWTTSACSGFMAMCIMSSSSHPTDGQQYGAGYVFETIGWLLAIAPALLSYWDVTGEYRQLTEDSGLEGSLDLSHGDTVKL